MKSFGVFLVAVATGFTTAELTLCAWYVQQKYKH